MNSQPVIEISSAAQETGPVVAAICILYALAVMLAA